MTTGIAPVQRHRDRLRDPRRPGRRAAAARHGPRRPADRLADRAVRRPRRPRLLRRSATTTGTSGCPRSSTMPRAGRLHERSFLAALPGPGGGRRRTCSPTWPPTASALLDHLGIESAHVVGASMGGMIAQTMAIEHPTRVRTLTSIMSTTGEPESASPRPRRSPGARCSPAADHPRGGDRQRASRPSQVISQPGALRRGRWRGSGAEEAYDRCFHPAGVARQLLAILASGSRAEGLAALDVPTARDPRRRRPARHALRRRAHRRADPRRRAARARGHGPRPAPAAPAAGRRRHHRPRRPHPTPERRKDPDVRTPRGPEDHRDRRASAPARSAP